MGAFSETEFDLAPARVKEIIDAGEAQLVDVREPYEWDAGHIPGAVKIDWTAYRPPQPRHACGKENNPPAETYSAPDPLHRRQGVAWVPGLAPLPPHSLQLAS